MNLNLDCVKIIFKRIIAVLLIIATGVIVHAQTAFADKAEKERKLLQFFKADNLYIQYMGRIDFPNPALPRFWSLGVYVKAKFRDTQCEIILNDEVLNSNIHDTDLTEHQKIAKELTSYIKKLKGW